MLTRISFFLIFLLPATAECTDVEIPVMNFKEAYESASDIVYVKFIDEFAATKKPKVFQAADQRDVRTGRFKVMKQWKGAKRKTIELTFWRDFGGQHDMEATKLISNPGFSKGRELLIFVHDDSGLKVMSPYWGRYFLGEKRPLSKFNFANGLDEISAGKPLDLVVQERHLDHGADFK